MAPPDGLLQRSGSSKTAPTPLFSSENGFSRKTFGRAPVEEPEPEPERGPATQALKLANRKVSSLRAGLIIQPTRSP
jgi:hypothetical protein